MAIALWFVSVELFRRPPAATDASAAAVLADLRRSGLVGVFVLLRALMLLGAAGFMLLLAFDPRYRGFPWPLYALPTMGLLLVRLARPAPRRGGRPGESDPGAIASPGESTAYEENLCASLIALASAAVLVIERPSNQQALAFVALMLLMAGLASGFRYGFAPGAGKGGRANTSALASTPTADGSTQ